MPANPQAREIAGAIYSDAIDRSILNGVDEETCTEIVQEWTRIIAESLAGEMAEREGRSEDVPHAIKRLTAVLDADDYQDPSILHSSLNEAVKIIRAMHVANSDWIDCRERMPTFGEIVDLSCPPQTGLEARVTEGFWNGTHWDNYDWNQQMEPDRVTHWLPKRMPASPPAPHGETQ